MWGKTFPTTAHKKFIFELVKRVCFADTKIHKIKIPRFTSEQLVSVHHQIHKKTGLFIKMNEASEITGKRMTNKRAVENFWKTCAVSGHYFAKVKRNNTFN